MLRYASTIFLSAFLLFQVQPLAARLILPVLGGTATVWATCIVYFQIMLLLGYLYAHLIRTLLSPRFSWAIHLLLLIAAWYWLRFNELVSDVELDRPMSTIVAWRLSYSIGLPFLALSATGPLIQAWHGISHPGQRTYRLYAVSNTGSLLALLSYPFVFDRFLGVGIQKVSWQWGSLIFCVLMIVSGLQTVSLHSWDDSRAKVGSADSAKSRPGILLFLLWILLTATASLLLLATTNILCQEVASYPFLWILPLTFYLLSLMICFDRPDWYRRPIFQPALAISIFVAILLFHLGSNAGLLLQVIGSAAVMFTGAMVCHGELYRLRPDTRYLTWFYLTVAMGGAVGGLLSVAVAPKIFNGYFEFHIALLACLLISVSIVVVELVKLKLVKKWQAYSYAFVSICAATPVLCSLVFYLDPGFQPGLILRKRNDYGVLAVKDSNGYRSMFNGKINHGGQYLDPSRSNNPSAYYTKGSGADVAFATIRKWRNEETGVNLHVGVIGLGTGSLVSHGQARDRFRFYEINPLVAEVARNYFTYLDDRSTTVIIGDGRVKLEQELAEFGSHEFDLLFIDAFSSDSIPIHLLTSECFDLYFRHLKDDGIIVAHITNKFVDMRPVIWSIAGAKRLTSVIIEHENPDFDVQTRWVLLSRNPNLENESTVQEFKTSWPKDMARLVWTDDMASLAPVVIWSSKLRMERLPMERVKSPLEMN